MVCNGIIPQWDHCIPIPELLATKNSKCDVTVDIMDAMAEDVAAVMDISIEDAVATIEEAVYIVEEEQRIIQQEAAEEAATLDAARAAESTVDEAEGIVPEETQEDTDTDGIAD